MFPSPGRENTFGYRSRIAVIRPETDSGEVESQLFCSGIEWPEIMSNLDGDEDEQEIPGVRWSVQAICLDNL